MDAAEQELPTQASARPAPLEPADTCAPGSARMDRIIFTFDTTHHALWAEEIAREHRIAHEVIPAPPAAHARCDIAVETLPDQVDAFERALADSGVTYRIWVPGG
jgi:hypothetical protein